MTRVNLNSRPVGSYVPGNLQDMLFDLDASITSFHGGPLGV